MQDKIKVTIDFDVLKELQSRAKVADDALNRIYNVIMERRDDIHGNAESRSLWLDRILVESRAALASAGYHVNKIPFTLPVEPREVDIPQFVKEGRI